MKIPVELALFSHLVRQPEGELDLTRAALLVAEAEYPRLDVEHYVALLDEMGESARREIEKPRRGKGTLEPEAKVARLLRWLYEQVGFRGNSSDYYDPRNSFLNDVLERRVGIPISLALIIIEVGRRVGIPTQGVSFPGHFLVRAPSSAGLLIIDPFDGRVLRRADLRAFHARATGDDREPSARLLEPASKRQILVRMLNNLRGIYASRGDRERLKNVLEKMAVLVQSEELQRQLEQLGGGPAWLSSGGHALN